MMYAKKIKMKFGCNDSLKCEEIESIYLEGNNTNQFYKKETLHDFLKENPNTIKVKDSLGPYVIPAVSINREKYVKSEPNYTKMDNLLSLPRV